MKRIDNLLETLGRNEFLSVSTNQYEIRTWGRANAIEVLVFNLLICSSQLVKEECATMVLFLSHTMTKKILREISDCDCGGCREYGLAGTQSIA